MIIYTYILISTFQIKFRPLQDCVIKCTLRLWKSFVTFVKINLTMKSVLSQIGFKTKVNRKSVLQTGGVEFERRGQQPGGEDLTKEKDASRCMNAKLGSSLAHAMD